METLALSLAVFPVCRIQWAAEFRATGGSCNLFGGVMRVGDCELTEGITDEHLSLIYADPFIRRVARDGQEFAPIHHPLVTYLSAWRDGQFMGAYIAVKFSVFEIEAHALLMKHATKLSRVFSQLFLDWAFAQGVMRVTASIIEGLESVVNHCLKIGFQKEGFKRNALTVGGEIRGVHILGMTKEEYELRW